MLLDFDEHRLHRKALSAAFKIEPMKAYLSRLNDGVASAVAAWRAKGGDMLFYPAIKQLTLELAATSFFGRNVRGGSWSPLEARVHRYGGRDRRGRESADAGYLDGARSRGRAFMVDYLSREIEARRASHGEDLFTELCKASMEDGRLLSPPEIVDHMSFLMMAAHDTLTSSLSAFVWFMSSNPRWQTQLREECRALGLAPGEPLPYERLDDLTLTEMAFKESLAFDFAGAVASPSRGARYGIQGL